MKKIFLMTLTNFLIIFTLTIIGSMINADIFLTKIGLDYKILLLFSVAWGFGISFLTLLLSKWTAKFFLKIHMINPNQYKMSSFEARLYQITDRLAKKAGIKTPEIGFYDSANEINAFATGFSKNNSLIAFTSNLFNVMDWEEIEGVIAHEISHIKNDDMVTMTLIQGVINAFAMFFSRIISFLLINSVFGEKTKLFYFTYYIYNWIILFFESIFLWAGSFITSYVSRKREFKADHDAVFLVGKRKMIKTLYCLLKHENYDQYNDMKMDSVFNSFKIHSNHMSFFGLLKTHPPLRNRINAINKIEINEDLDLET